MWHASCVKRSDLPLFLIDATTARGMYDPYSVLGLSRTAGEDEVKHAFRRLAKRFHPDTPEGASDKGRRFKDLSIAYEILGDARKRRAYDRGEIDAHGNPRAGYRPPPPEAEPEPSFTARASTRPSEPPPGASSAQSQRGEGPSASFRSAFERAFGGNVGGAAPKSESRVEDLFAEFFGDRQEGTTRRAKDGEAGSHFDLQITFEEAVLGGSRRVKLPDGKRFDVRVPIGVKDGHTIRLSGLGANGESGEATVVISVEPHPYFRRDGDDILLSLPVTLAEAIHGAKINVPTLHGAVAMTIPGGSSSGQVLRLKGKGVPAHAIHAPGDQLVTLQIVLPDQADSELADMIKRWETAHPYDPRRKMGGV
jgi:DnaJ-class molecular chaperone